MAREKHWPLTGPFPFTSNGGSEGEIEVNDTCGLYTKQQIILKSSTTQRVDLEIKRVLSSTKLKVGPRGHGIDKFTNITSFLVVDGAAIHAPEQSFGKIPPTVIEQSEWMHEPINAKRTADIDCYGDQYTRINPKPVTGGLSKEEDIKCKIIGAPDVLKDLTWAEIDGVRRVIKIVFTSASVDAILGATHTLNRDFTYLIADPFDLDKIQDNLVIV